jgi:hypothetical protein
MQEFIFCSSSYRNTNYLRTKARPKFALSAAFHTPNVTGINVGQTRTLKLFLVSFRNCISCFSVNIQHGLILCSLNMYMNQVHLDLCLARGFILKKAQRSSKYV